MTEENDVLDDEEMDEAEDNLLVLTDEDGQDVEFECLDQIDYEDGKYVVLLPTDESEEDAIEVLILEMRLAEGEDPEDEDAEFEFAPVESEELLDKLYDMFCAKHQDDFSFAD